MPLIFVTFGLFPGVFVNIPMNASLIFCSDRLVVVNKPAGISLATRRSEPHAAAGRLIAALPKESLESFGLEAGKLWLVHRLDVGTTGAVLLARDANTHRELSHLLNLKLIRKSYLALVWGHPRPPSGRYGWPMSPDLRDRRRMKVNPEGRPAATNYKTLARGPHVSLLELIPETGRTHQLRVHLSHAGHWIVGDDLYGGARHLGVKDPQRRALLNPPHLLLHAWRLELPDASSLFPKKYEAPLPPVFASILEAFSLDSAFQTFAGTQA